MTKKYMYKKDEVGEMGKLQEAMATNADTTRLAQVLETHPYAAREKGGSGMLPLHYALENHASKATVKLVYEAYPEAAREKHGPGKLPLHEAVENHAGAEVVELLLEAHEEGASVADKYGWLPLHLAVEKQAGAEVVLFEAATWYRYQYCTVTGTTIPCRGLLSKNLCPVSCVCM